jgi:hypothetical protein
MTNKMPQTIAAGLIGISLMVAGAGCAPTPPTATQPPTVAPQANATPQPNTTQPPNVTPQPSSTPQSNAIQTFSCTGRKTNGWEYDAKFLDGRFTQITWTRSGQPTYVSPLTFDRNNDQGQPIYRGSFQAATAISLVDLGKGNVRPGSEVSVGTEEWGWARGTCAIAK